MIRSFNFSGCVACQTHEIDNKIHLTIQFDNFPIFNVVVDREFTEEEMKDFIASLEKMFVSRIKGLEDRMKNPVIYGFIDKLSGFNPDLG